MSDKERIRRRKRLKIADEQCRTISWPRLLAVIILVASAILFYALLNPTEGEASTSWATRYQSEYKTDYYLHYVEGAAIGTVAWLLIPDSWELNNFQKWLVSVGTATLYKSIYEMFDTGGDYRDVVEVATGACIVVPIFIIRW